MRPSRWVTAVLIDIGGVLVPDYLTAAAAAWGRRLGMAPYAFLAALFAGNDDEVLVGRTTEIAWWRVVADRLGVGDDRIAEIRRDLAARVTWNLELLARLRALPGRAAIAVVSNAWPDIHDGIAASGLDEIADAVVLSCEVGYAKPDPRIYRIALERLGVQPADALFIDDTPGHVDAAQALGMAGHVHVDTGQTLARLDSFLGQSQASLHT